MHRPLGDRVQRIARLRRRLVPDRQRVHAGLEAGAEGVGRLHRAETAGGEAEALQRLAVELHRDRLGRGQPAGRVRRLEIGAVAVLEIALFRRQWAAPEAAVLHVAVELRRVRRADAVGAPVRPAPPGQRADPRRALVPDDVIPVAAGEGRCAVFRDEAREREPRAEVDQHVLERPHVAVGRDHGLPDRVGRAVCVADRPIEEGEAVPALQIGGVGQHQVGVGDHLRAVGIGVDDPGDAVAPA